MVVAEQLTARLLLIPGEPGSNPVIGNFYFTFVYFREFVEKAKNERKRGWEWTIKKPLIEWNIISA